MLRPTSFAADRASPEGYAARNAKSGYDESHAMS